MIIKRLYNTPTYKLINTFDEVDRFRNLINAFTGSPLGRLFDEPDAGVFPLINLTENVDNYYVRAELPGVTSEELEITATGSKLTISGERKISTKNPNAKYHRKEREAGKFSRILNLPEHINAKKIDAKIKDGILRIALPKSENLKPKKITIH